MAKTIRVGVLGAGFIGRVHLEQFGKQAGTVLAGIADFNEAAARAAAETYGVEKVYATAEELIASKDIDAVVVGVPNKFHKAYAIAALDAGKDLLLEKPIALNVAEAAEIERARKRSGRLLMLAHQLRWAWPYREAAAQTAAGELGTIYHAKAGWMRRKGIPGWGSWFTRFDESGGGPLIDIGVHMLDAAMWLMGSPKPVEVFGATYAEFGPRRMGIGSWGTPDWNGRFDVEDFAAAIVRFDNGATLGLEVSWAAHTDSDGASFVHLMGSDGGASIYGDRVKFFGERFGRAYSVESPSPANAADPRALLSAHFLDCVRERKEPSCGIESGLATMAVIDAIYRSQRSGKSVSVNEESIEI